MRPRAVVVLAGGSSRRFGRDKLTAGTGPGPQGPTLLDLVLRELPADAEVVVVGPERPVARAVRFAREQPPGGGPVAGLVAGLRALGTGAAGGQAGGWVGVLPGDAPAAATALPALGQALALAGREGAVAAVAVDPSGVLQPLQLALAPEGVRRLLAAAGSGAGSAARPLVLSLDPVRVQVPARAAWDVDTPEQLRIWQLSTGPAVDSVLRALAELTVGGGPAVLALDGPSGAGKTALATALALRTGASVLEGDDFYSPLLGSQTLAHASARPVAELAADGVVDWRRLRLEGLEPLAAGRPARYRRYDWSADDGRLEAGEVVVPAGPLVVVEGVYTARPELADLVDLPVRVHAPAGLRARRVLERDGDSGGWTAVWSAAERHYFTNVRPDGDFALHLDGAAPLGGS